VDKILDTAGQKGTGKWTVISSQDLGIPITLIAEAVYARCISALKEERVAAAKKLKGPKPAIKGDQKQLIEDIRRALYASKIVSYAQGYMLMRAAAKEHKWNLNYGGIALMWRGGCIIRSVFLAKIKEAFGKNPQLSEPAPRSVLPQGDQGFPTLLAQGRRPRRPQGHPGAGLQHGAGVLRLLSQRASPRQPPPGSARLLRRAYLRAS
jgi:6-phosphogluconate dehydrogenase